MSDNSGFKKGYFLVESGIAYKITNVDKNQITFKQAYEIPKNKGVKASLPLSKVEHAIIKKPYSEQHANVLLKKLSEKSANKYSPEKLETALKAYDMEEVVNQLNPLHQVKSKSTLNDSDQELYDSAIKHLSRVISNANDNKPQTARRKILKSLNKN